MADLKDSSQPPQKHRVIHWNPVEDEGQANAKPAVKAYLGGALVALLVIALAGGGYFLFLHKPALTAQQAAELAPESSDPRRAFESVSYAQGLQDSVNRKLEAALQMPTTGNETLRGKLINIQKEKIDADTNMRRANYARAVSLYNNVNGLIDEFVKEVESKQKAQGLYDSFLVRSEELDTGRHLANKDFENAFKAASEGKSFLDAGSFAPALQRLEHATASLNAVEKSIDDAIRRNAAEGNRFIAQGKSADAIKAFTAVLELDPENEDALKLLERARIADKTYAALQVAESAEKEGNLEKALEGYERAASIDAASAKAQAGVSRARRAIQDRDFTRYFLAAKEAESALRYEDAIENYQAALNIYPTRTDLEASIDQARADKRQNDIVSRVTRAYDFEREYDWENARDLYQELVNMEPGLQEAKEGLLRTGRMIRSILRYQTLIEVAKTEAQRAEFQQAIRTFDQAMQAKPTYLALTDEGERLRRFLQLQSQPVPVQIISDEATWVSIQGPTQRKPEKISTETISLLPGKYFVIGRKKGYQDVRVALQIRAGMAQQPLTVICDTKNDY